MKAIYKIIILCAAIFALSVFATKKSIDYTFKKVESSQVDSTASILNSSTESVEV
ncbi:MAG: hypothetical protein WBV45_14160 [Lutimonas sp.]